MKTRFDKARTMDELRAELDRANKDELVRMALGYVRLRDAIQKHKDTLDELHINYAADRELWLALEDM